MTPTQYHQVLQHLDAVLKVFSEAGANVDANDAKVRDQLWMIRTQILKAESGHPFPFAASDPARAARTEARPATVLVADDHESVRAVLFSILEPEAAFELVGEAANGREAVDLARRRLPDVVLMDLDMPVLDGLSATREILELNPEIRVLMFSANGSPAAIAEAIEAGARGYLVKPASRCEIIRALEAVHQGRTVFPVGTGQPHST